MFARKFSHSASPRASVIAATPPAS
jgi:hypothetical protein